jgi:hypothetical protein
LSKAGLGGKTCPKKEKQEQAPALQMQLSTISIIVQGMETSRGSDWAGEPVQSLANVPLSAGQSRSEMSAKREAGKE